MLLLLALLSACSPTGSPEPLYVAAASSLAPVFDPLAAAFSEASGIAVILTYGSTGSLAQQLRNGAPYDLFAAADALHIDSLAAEGLLDPASRTVFAYGQLVLASSPSLPITAIFDLENPAVARIVIANPQHAPYGLAARQALESLGLWERLAPRIVFAESVRQAAQTVQSGNAEAGFLAASVAQDSPLRLLVIEPQLHAPIEHVAAVSLHSSRTSAAQAFLDFLLSSSGQDQLRQAGLLLVGE